MLGHQHRVKRAPAVHFFAIGANATLPTKVHGLMASAIWIIVDELAAAIASSQNKIIRGAE